MTTYVNNIFNIAVRITYLHVSYITIYNNIPYIILLLSTQMDDVVK